MVPTDQKAKPLIDWTKEDGLMFDHPRLLPLLFPLVGLCLALDLWIARMLFSLTPQDFTRLILQTGHPENLSRSLCFSCLLGFRAVRIGGVIHGIACRVQMRVYYSVLLRYDREPKIH